MFWISHGLIYLYVKYGILNICLGNVFERTTFYVSFMCLSAKECGGVLTDQQRIIQSPGFPEEYQDEQICYWHIRVRLGQRIRLHFVEFDVEDDTSCLADYLDVYDSYDDVSGFAGRWGSLREKVGSVQPCSSQNLIEQEQAYIIDYMLM